MESLRSFCTPNNWPPVTASLEPSPTAPPPRLPTTLPPALMPSLVTDGPPTTDKPSSVNVASPTLTPSAPTLVAPAVKPLASTVVAPALKDPVAPKSTLFFMLTVNVLTLSLFTASVTSILLPPITSTDS